MSLEDLMLRYWLLHTERRTPSPTPDEPDDAAYLRDLARRLHDAIHEHGGVVDGEGLLVIGDDDGMRLGDIARRLAGCDD